MPVFFPLYGEVRSSLLRFNPATISRPLRTSTSRPFRMSIPRHSMPAFILSIVPDAIRLFRRTGRPADTLVYKSHTRVCVYILRKGCPPVRLVYPLPSILRFALTSSMPLSLTIHPRVRAFPIRLLWKPACCSTIPKRLILIGFLMEPQETSLSEISAVVMN